MFVCQKPWQATPLPVSLIMGGLAGASWGPQSQPLPLPGGQALEVKQEQRFLASFTVQL